MAQTFKSKTLLARTGVFSHEVTAPNFIYNTGDQIISGEKNFYSRPTVNGTGVLLSGEAAALPETIVYITGNQIISGTKTFIENVQFTGINSGTFFEIFNGDIEIENANITISGGNINLYSRPKVNGTGVLLIGEVAQVNNVVYTTGDQIINGIKNFNNRPLVNGTGVLLSGEAASLPSTIVYTTGNQTINGVKTFTDTGIFGNMEISVNEMSISGLNLTLTDGTGIFYDKVGIGEEFPDAKLHIYGGNLKIDGGTDSTQSIYFMDDGNNNNVFELRKESVDFYTYGVAFQNKIDSKSYPLILEGSANIGIGTDMPSEKLEINGNIKAKNIVYNTGDQNISGLKNFIIKPTVNTIPVLLSGENANGLSVLIKNDETTSLSKGQPVYIYGANGNNILVRKASNTGEAYSSKTLGLLAQNLNSNEQGYVITEGSLEGVDTSSANPGDPIWLGPTGNLIFGLTNKPYAPNHLVYLGVVERKQANNGKIYVKIQNGFELHELHNVNIDHSYTLNNNDIIRYHTESGIWFNQPLNTGVFKEYINSLSGEAVLKYGYQDINGTKVFRDNVYINNLYVTGSETILNTINNNISSPYLLLNLTGGLTDGGIFFVTGVGLTGINDTGIIFGFDNVTKSWHFGQGTRLTDVSTLDEVMGYHDLTGYSGFANQTFSTIINLANTGFNLQGQINNLGNTYATVINLASTGSTLQTSINSLSGYSNSTFATITNLSNTGSTLQTNINTVSSNLVTTGSTLNSNINVLSGTLTSTYATITNLASTGSTLDSKINVLSGYGNNTFATITNLALTGSGLNSLKEEKISFLNYIFDNYTWNVSTGRNNYYNANTWIIPGPGTVSIYLPNSNSFIGDKLYLNITTTSNISANIYTWSPGPGYILAYTIPTNTNFIRGFFVSNVVSNLPIWSDLNNIYGYLYSYDAAQTYSTITNLANTGLNLNANINNLSGYINSSNSNIVFTTGNQLINGTKTFNSGVVINVQPTGTNPALNITGTWNNASQVYTGIALNIVDTASNSTSLLIDLKINNSGVFSVSKGGDLTLRSPSNSVSPRLYLENDNNQNLGSIYYENGHYRLTSDNGGFYLLNNNANLGFGTSIDTFIRRDAAGVLAQSNGNNPQQFQVYNITVTNSGEFGLFGWQNNNLIVGPQQTNSGILRDLTLTGNNININASGVFNIFDNTNIAGNLNVTGNLNTTGLVISGLGTPFILKSPNNTDSITFNPTLNGNAGGLFANWIYCSNMGSRGDDNYDFYYGGAGARSIRFIYGFSQITRSILDSNGNFGLADNITSVPAKLYVSGNSILQGNLTVSGNTTITGHLSAASKSFLINHPTQANKKLQYGSLESPYHGIRLTDKNKLSADSVKVNLPDYISALVNDEKVNIQLTNINHDKILFVKDVKVNENYFTVGMNRSWFDKNEYEFYWSFTAERKDIPKLTVEF